MQENYELVQRGFRILLGSMASYIGQTLHRRYKDKWWDEVCRALYGQRDLLESGEYGELVDSLDIANCIRILKNMWHEVFGDMLSRNCLTWAFCGNACETNDKKTYSVYVNEYNNRKDRKGYQGAEY